MEKAVLIDVSAIMYRAYFSLINMRNSKGIPTGAVYGFTNMLNHILNELKPDYIVACFDVSRNSLKRKAKYEGYKADRTAMPEDLREQVIKIEELLDGFNIKRFKKEGEEADDLLGTLAKKFEKENIESYIVTGDKDLSQVLTDKIKITLLGKGQNNLKILATKEDVKEQLGCYPEQIPDLFGLQGDKSDGIPGVHRIGPKTASKMIEDYNTLEKLYKNIEDIKGKKKEYLLNDKENAFLSRDLATINLDVDLELNFDSVKYREMDKNKLKTLFTELEFRAFLKKFNLFDTEGNSDKKEITGNIIENKKEIKINIVYDKKELNKIHFKKTLTLLENKAGISLSDGEETYYLPINHNFLGATNIPKKDVNEFLSSEIEINGYDFKNIFEDGYQIKNKKFDIMLAYYILNPEGNYDIDKIIFQEMGELLKTYKECFAKKDETTISITEMAEYMGKRSFYLYEIINILIEKLKENDLYDLFMDIEMKLVEVLTNMEMNGIKIDLDYFEKFRIELEEKLMNLEKKIYELANVEFNINSPKQLSQILFEDMEIKPIKKTKTGYSTNVDVLEKLKSDGILIADKILNYRKYNKLKNTYIDALPKLADVNNRLHTTFNQNGTATGRLSSSDPNLQNIPAKTKEGLKIREGFITEEGWSLLAADYSQIELRVLAEVSKDEHLIKAYRDNLDLHTQTAEKIFEIDAEKVTREERNLAKIVNFSIIYGKTAFGLSKELGIPVSDANNYINKYFENYSGVSRFIEDTISQAKKDGFVKTLFGRKRIIEGINSKNKNIAKQAERMAVNTIIQGTAADILKIVMIKIYDEIKNENDIKMNLQVHDELIFEVKDESIEKYTEKIKNIMENTIKFKNVDFVVEPKIGKNWSETK